MIAVELWGGPGTVADTTKKRRRGWLSTVPGEARALFTREFAHRGRYSERHDTDIELRSMIQNSSLFTICFLTEATCRDLWLGKD